MERVSLARSISWLVVVGGVLGAIGAYRYFSVPAELRFVRTDAAWIALSFLGIAVLAAVLLLLLGRQKADTSDE